MYFDNFLYNPLASIEQSFVENKDAEVCAKVLLCDKTNPLTPFQVSLVSNQEWLLCLVYIYWIISFKHIYDVALSSNSPSALSRGWDFYLDLVHITWAGNIYIEL